ncbi:MAG: diacylglycerol kinase family protein, partial [Ilumatobacteraceae bacterium]
RPAVVVDVASAAAVGVDDLRRALGIRARARRVDWYEVGDTIDPDGRVDPDGIADDGDGVAARAVASGAPTVIACGDDTTVRRCLEAVVGTSTALGIVSLGSGALLAANLGLPPGLESVPHALEGDVVRLDVGDANGEVFAVHAGFGVDALHGVRAAGDQGPGIGEVLRQLVSLRRRHAAVIVHVDGVQRFEGRTACLLVANCSGGPGRGVLVPDVEPTDGMLDLAVLAPRGPLAWAQVLWRLAMGRPQRPEHVLRARGEWVFVQLWRRHAYELDGEPRPPARRLDVRVWPEALAVRVPPAPSDDEPSADERAGDEPSGDEPSGDEPAGRAVPPGTTSGAASNGNDRRVAEVDEASTN